jgi:hypothetical protein
MKNLDRDVYATRIRRLNDASRLLGEQGEIDRRLIEGYNKAVAMIQIEIESFVVADWISHDATDRIEAKLAELEALKEAIQDRARKLAANEELERFLSPTVSPLGAARTPAEQTKAPPEPGGDFAPSMTLEEIFDELDNGDDAERRDRG